ncbi:hypothetical protein PRIPAC_85395 [Pristionchus pacificus]|nr:hypothetical protein PRIPAC_85395 [Pristionchus pacificus]
MDIDFNKTQFVVEKNIVDAMGHERLNKLIEMIRSVRIWRKNDIECILKRYSNRLSHGDITLKNLFFDERRMIQFLLVIYRVSFPSSLIGEKNIEKLMMFITRQQMNCEKNKNGGVQYPPLLKYRFINWLKNLKCEREKRHLVQRVSNYIVDYMRSIIRFCFKSINRTDSVLVVPIYQYRFLEKRCFNDYKKRCKLIVANKVPSSTFDLKFVPVGYSLRPIVMANKNWKEKRRRDKICMAALLFHSTVFGVSSESNFKQLSIIIPNN